VDVVEIVAASLVNTKPLRQHVHFLSAQHRVQLQLVQYPVELKKEGGQWMEEIAAKVAST